MPPINNPHLAKDAVDASVILREKSLAGRESRDGEVAPGLKRVVADPRRQMAQMAAKSRWAEWASKKTI